MERKSAHPLSSEDSEKFVSSRDILSDGPESKYEKSEQEDYCGDEKENSYSVSVLVSYIILTIVALILIYVVLSPSFDKYDLFAKNNNFPPLIVISIATVISLIFLAYACFILSKGLISIFSLSVFTLYSLFTIFWFANLDRRVFNYSMGKDFTGNGSLYLILSLALLLFFFVRAWYSDIRMASICTVPVILWTLCLIYIWWQN